MHSIIQDQLNFRMATTNYLGFLQELCRHHVLLLCSISVCLISMYLLNRKFRSNRGNLKLLPLPPGPSGFPLIGSIKYSKFGLTFIQVLFYLSISNNESNRFRIFSCCCKIENL